MIAEPASSLPVGRDGRAGEWRVETSLPRAATWKRRHAALTYSYKLYRENKLYYYYLHDNTNALSVCDNSVITDKKRSGRRQVLPCTSVLCKTLKSVVFNLWCNYDDDGGASKDDIHPRLPGASEPVPGRGQSQ